MSRARLLHTASINRDLDESELQELAGLVEVLTKSNDSLLSSIAYDAMRRTYLKRKKRGQASLALRSMVKEASALLRRMRNRNKEGT